MGAMTNRRAEVPATWPLPAVRLRPQYPQHSMGGGGRFLTLVQADLTLRTLASMYYGCWRAALKILRCSLFLPHMVSTCFTVASSFIRAPGVLGKTALRLSPARCGQGDSPARTRIWAGVGACGRGESGKSDRLQEVANFVAKTSPYKLPTSAAEVGNSRRTICQFPPRKFLAAILRGNRSFAPVLAFPDSMLIVTLHGPHCRVNITSASP